MDKKTSQMRKALGYDSDEEVTNSQGQDMEQKIPSWVFGYSALASFIIGLIGMGVELSSEEQKYLLLYFSISIFLAPSLLIYPFIRILLGEGKPFLAAITSALFGGYVQSSIKKKMDKWS